jgi:hypothetical protein
MIGLKEVVKVKMEVEFEVIVGELVVMERNFLDQPLEKFVAMWGDQATQARLWALLHRLETSDGRNTTSNKTDGRRRG